MPSTMQVRRWSASEAREKWYLENYAAKSVKIDIFAFCDQTIKARELIFSHMISIDLSYRSNFLEKRYLENYPT